MPIHKFLRYMFYVRTWFADKKREEVTLVENMPKQEHLWSRLVTVGVLGNVVISKKFLHTRKIHLGDA